MIFIPLLCVFLNGSISEQTAPTCHNGLSGDYVAQSDDLPNLYFLVLSGYTLIQRIVLCRILSGMCCTSPMYPLRASHLRLQT